MGRVTEVHGAASRPAEGGHEDRAGWTVPFISGVLAVAAVGVVLVGAVVAFQLLNSDVVYPGVRVGGIEVGGMTRERALADLRPVLARRETEPVVVRGADTTRQISLGELGASFDVAAAVDAAFAVGRVGGWRERISEQLAAMLRGHDVEAPGLRLDRSRIQAFVAGAAREIDRPVRDAELTIGQDLSVRVTPSVVGRKTDVAKAVAMLESALVAGTGVVELPVIETAPRRTEGDLAAVSTRLARMLSGPVALEFESRQWTLSPGEILDLVSLDEKPGLPAPVLSLKEEPLKRMVDRIAGEIDQPKVNARYDWNGGNLKLLRAGQDGRKVDREAALADLKGAMEGDRRVVPLPVAVDKAAGGSADPASLGIKERIELGRTTVAGVPEKVHNIKLAASRLNGVLLGPGDIFSFNRELGPTTLKSGFQTGFGISVSNGEMQTVPSVAGGICQVATTLLHAVFWAGYQIEERYPHMYWIPNYGRPPRGMVGLDATVDDPVLDFKFTNNTDHNLLIQSKVEGNTLEFALYGTRPDWQVSVEGPIITNVVKADTKTVRQEEPSWPEGREVWVESAQDGMDVEIIRRVTQGGEVRTLQLKSRYQPSRNVLMVGTKKPAPTPTPQATPGPTATPGAASQAPGATPQPAAATARPGAPSPRPATATPQRATPTPRPTR